MNQPVPEQNEETCACGGSCGCGGHNESSQVYLTREEYVERLKEYIVELKAELASVEAELAELTQPA